MRYSIALAQQPKHPVIPFAKNFPRQPSPCPIHPNRPSTAKVTKSKNNVSIGLLISTSSKGVAFYVWHIPLKDVTIEFTAFYV